MLFLQLPPVIFFFLLRLRCLTGHVREEEAGFEQENKMQLNSRIKYFKKRTKSTPWPTPVTSRARRRCLFDEMEVACSAGVTFAFFLVRYRRLDRPTFFRRSSEVLLYFRRRIKIGLREFLVDTFITTTPVHWRSDEEVWFHWYWISISPINNDKSEWELNISQLWTKRETTKNTKQGLTISNWTRSKWLIG
jgi:hypothetical protein